MTKQDADALKETFRGFNYVDCVDIMGILADQVIFKHPSMKRLGAYRFEDKAIILGAGPWAKKIGKLYQNWFAQQVDITPPEFTLDELSKGMIGTLFDSFNRKQLHVAITYLQQRLETCQSTSLEKAQETLKSFSSEKPLDVKKLEKADPSSGDQASS